MGNPAVGRSALFFCVCLFMAAPSSGTINEKPHPLGDAKRLQPTEQAATTVMPSKMSRDEARHQAIIEALLANRPSLRATGCGDGLPDAGEQCDDGNLANGDGCSDTCAIELPFVCTDATGTSEVDDPGFELGGITTTGSANPFWSESSSATSFEPICSEEVCLGGGDLALDGSHFLWFGGIDPATANTQSVSQAMTIPVGATELSFWSLRGICFASGTDAVTVTISPIPAPVATITCDATDADWVQNTVDITGYADGLSHTITFSGTTNGDGLGTNFTNIFIDFVNIDVPGGITAVPSVCSQSCGDGLPDPGEQCDDGNPVDGDGCSSACQVETGFTCSAALPSVPEDAVADGSLENGGLLTSGAANPDWAETGNFDLDPPNGAFFTPICNPTACGVDIAETGTHYGWFGGIDPVVDQFQSLTQTVILPASATTLTFSAFRGLCSSLGTDFLLVRIDGNPVQQILCDTTDSNYVEYSIDLATAPGGPYNNGGAHSVSFVAKSNGLGAGDFTNIFLDDVSILTGGTVPGGPSVCTENCYDFDFGPAGAGDLTGWTTFQDGVASAPWGLTDDGICWSNNLPGPPAANVTGGDGEAACVDSDAVGVSGLVNSYLCSPLIDYAAATNPALSFFYNYQIFGAGTGEDAFEVLVGTAPPDLLSIGGYTSVFSTSANQGELAALPGESELIPVGAQAGYVCFRYGADFDWYAQLDNVAITAEACTAPSGITGTPSDASLQAAACRNSTTGQIVFVPGSGTGTFDCTAAGLSASPGDQVLTFALGTASCGGGTCTGVGETVTGFSGQAALCGNDTTGQSQIIPLSGAQSVDCSGVPGGFSDGDAVRLIVLGTAL